MNIIYELRAREFQDINFESFWEGISLQTALSYRVNMDLVNTHSMALSIGGQLYRTCK